MSNPTWKQIEDTGYLVSDTGSVYSPRLNRNLKLVKTSRGYHQVTIKGKTCHVHRLVAFAFSDGTSKNYGMSVNHKNGIKTDNNAINLEWCTQLENERHARSTGLKNMNGSSNGNSKLLERDVIKIRRLLEKGIPRRSIAKIFNVSTTAIGDINIGRSWSWLKEE